MDATTSIQHSSQVDRFLARVGKLFIDGRWIDAEAGRTLPVVDPATERTLAHVADAGAADVDQAVHAARRAFESGPWSGMTPSERCRWVWKIGDLIESHKEEFAELDALDNGKPITIARAADTTIAAEMFHYMAGWATKLEGNTIPLSVPYAPGEQWLSYTQREPIGVVGQIIPWNFPLVMVAWKLAPALTCGCTVVLKPSEETPLSALRLAELLQEADLPAGVVNIVTGYGQTAGAALAAHPDVDKIAFTGSTEVGRQVVQAAGRTNLKKVTLELGGKSPNIILPDADLEAAVPGAANAVFYNQGQNCCAGTRLFAHRDQFDHVIQGMAEQAEQFKLGPGLDPETTMGPLVSQAQFDRVNGYVQSGREQGAEVAAGGQRWGQRGYFIQPTLLTGVKPDMKVVREEIFGPVVTAMPYDDLDDLARQANDTEYGLAAGIWTRDISQAHHLARQIRAGTVWINCYNVVDAPLPFGGYKQSGWGREMGHEVLNNYTEVKAVTVNLWTG